jgi:proteasome lid subunit RPN8/RPN11
VSSAARVDIDAGAWQTIRADVADRLPQEACGALLGHASSHGKRRVCRAVPVANEALDATTRYCISGARVLELEREAHAAGMELLGFYHSHPRGNSEPSPLDEEAAWPWYLYLVVPGGGREPPRCWVGQVTGGLMEVSL